MNEKGIFESVKEAIKPLTYGNVFTLVYVKFETYYGNIIVSLSSDEMNVLFCTDMRTNTDFFCNIWIKNYKKTLDLQELRQLSDNHHTAIELKKKASIQYSDLPLDDSRYEKDSSLLLKNSNFIACLHEGCQIIHQDRDHLIQFVSKDSP